MRRPSQRQSAIRAPLSSILGTEAQVRLLRSLSDYPGPVSRSELGRMAGLGEKGAHLAAERLLSQGILQLVGRGVRQQVEFNTRHPLAGAIHELFRVERAVADSFLSRLRSAAQTLGPDIDSAWIEGSFAREEDRPGEPLTIGLLADGKILADVVTRMRDAVAPVEASMDVTIEIAGLTRPDLAAMSPAQLRRFQGVLLLHGPPPLAYAPGAARGAIRNKVLHSDRENAQLRLASAIADRILRDPSKIRTARDYVARRLTTASEQERHALEEWGEILNTMSIRRLHRFLTDSGERAARLRQTLPFLDVLSPEERDAILSSTEDR